MLILSLVASIYYWTKKAFSVFFSTHILYSLKMFFVLAKAQVYFSNLD